MNTRSEFFEIKIDYQVLEEYSRSDESTIRWAAAIELGQIGTQEAIFLLWNLTSDTDEHVRDAANLGLQNCDQEIVGKVLAAEWVDTRVMSEGKNDEPIQKHTAWKIRPLELPTLENQWAVDAAILNIIQTEGPVTGSRILRLYGTASNPGNPRKIPKSRVNSAVMRLQDRKLVGIIESTTAKEFEFWTLYKSGSPEVVVREQGQRKLSEIPVTEVIARVKLEMGDEFDYAGQDEKFMHLQRAYGIKQSELHIVGEILTSEWSEFLN